MEKQHKDLEKICGEYCKKFSDVEDYLKTPREKVQKYIEFPKISYKELERRSVRPHFL